MGRPSWVEAGQRMPVAPIRAGQDYTLRRTFGGQLTAVCRAEVVCDALDTSATRTNGDTFQGDWEAQDLFRSRPWKARPLQRA